MEIDPQIQSLAADLAASAIRNSAQAVSDKIGALRARSQDRETINGLEQLVNELIADKNELTRIAQAYQSELVSQRLVPGDIKYIVESIVPLVRHLAASGDQGEQVEEVMALVEPLLSIETVNVLQLLGFNFAEALGEPLTRLISSLIAARTPVTAAQQLDVQRLVLSRDIALAKVARDQDATARLRTLAT